MRGLFFAISLVLVVAPVRAQTPSAEATARAAPVAGKVELVEGDARAYDRSQQARRLAAGDAVYEGDSLVTGKDGEMHVSLADGGFIAVRPDTRLSIVTYRAQGQSDDRGVFSLLQGAFRSVTGWIGKYNPKSYQVRTPTATIGVRGTDHEPLVIPQGSSAGEPGTYDKVNVGGSYIQTRHGRVDVAPNQAAFAPWRGKPVPRLLKEVPGFYRPTRNEALLAGRHETIQKVLEQRRDERRKLLLERKSVLEKQRIDRQKARNQLKQREDTERSRQREERRKQWREQRGSTPSEHRTSAGAERGLRHPSTDERRHGKREVGARPQDGAQAGRRGGRGRD